jgi:penicillin-binding protein 1C
MAVFQHISSLLDSAHSATRKDDCVIALRPGAACPLPFNTRVMRSFWITVLVIVALAVSALLAVPSKHYSPPSFEAVKASYKKSEAVLLDRHGLAIQELRIDPKGRRLDWTGIQDISPALKRAVVDSEDRRFSLHSGVDWRAAGAAFLGNIFSGKTRGASTITMQLATMLDSGLKPHGTKKTLAQKWLQMGEAREIERSWTKDEIFEAYLNLVSFRGELQGIEAASRGLFGKEPSGLDEAESFILASLIRSPNAPAGVVAGRACALGRAAGSGTRCEEMRSLTEKVLTRPYSISLSEDLAPHAARRLLRAGEVSVVSTLDRDLQRFAAEVLRHHLSSVRSRNVNDGAVLVVENKTGEILAYVGGAGRDSTAWYVDGIQAKRQAGSTLKPFLYATAFERRILTPASVLSDGPTDVPTALGIYRPEDYENDFKGLITARTALASSLNVPAVKVLSLVGVEDLVRKLNALGMSRLESPDFYGPSLALGSADVDLYELVNAYRTLANRGIYRQLLFSPGEKTPRGRRVFSEEAAFLVSDILSDRAARSVTFGLENPLSTPFWSAVKTGTSKDMRDNWCIGYSPKYTVGVWVGNFSGGPMWDVSGITGAAPVWSEIMNYLHREGTSWLPRKPAGVVAARVRFENGYEDERSEWFIRGTEPVSQPVNGASLQRIARSSAPKIVYPVENEIIAIDPDIPRELQLVFFEALAGPASLRWRLNGTTIGRASDVVSWKPDAGSYHLSLVDDRSRVVDSVDFSVRGN